MQKKKTKETFLISLTSNGIDFTDVRADEAEGSHGDVDQSLKVEEGGGHVGSLELVHLHQDRVERVPTPMEQLEERLKAILEKKIINC